MAAEQKTGIDASAGDGGWRLAGRRRDRFLFRVLPERVLELAADPTRFPEFNPFIRVPETSGRVEDVGNVYHQVFVLGPIRRIVDLLLMRPLLTVGLAWLGRRIRRWIESEAD